MAARDLAGGSGSRGLLGRVLGGSGKLPLDPLRLCECKNAVQEDVFWESWGFWTSWVRLWLASARMTLYPWTRAQPLTQTGPSEQPDPPRGPGRADGGHEDCVVGVVVLRLRCLGHH